MASDRKDKLHPKGISINIAIFLDDFQRFKELFNKETVYNFFVNSKKVIGKEVIFNVRSQRVNEFVDILDEHKINWRDL